LPNVIITVINFNTRGWGIDQYLMLRSLCLISNMFGTANSTGNIYSYLVDAHFHYMDSSHLPFIFVNVFGSVVHSIYIYIYNSVALVRERTIPTERPPLVGEVSAKFCG
jgi:hypothetical protein